MISQILSSSEQFFKEILSNLEEGLRVIRAGRANSGLVEDLEVSAYGSKMKLKELASIAVPDASLITITPWDKSVAEAIVNALNHSNLGVNSVLDGNMVRVVVPRLSEERREDLIRQVGKLCEESRVSLRRRRQEILKQVEDESKKGGVSEDEVFRFKSDLQKKIDQVSEEIDSLKDRKIEQLKS